MFLPQKKLEYASESPKLNKKASQATEVANYSSMKLT
jgi:hypothetical protein